MRLGRRDTMRLAIMCEIHWIRRTRKNWRGRWIAECRCG